MRFIFQQIRFLISQLCFPNIPVVARLLFGDCGCQRDTYYLQPDVPSGCKMKNQFGSCFSITPYYTPNYRDLQHDPRYFQNHRKILHWRENKLVIVTSFPFLDVYVVSFLETNCTVLPFYQNFLGCLFNMWTVWCLYYYSLLFSLMSHKPAMIELTKNKRLSKYKKYIYIFFRKWLLFFDLVDENSYDLLLNVTS